MKEYDRFKLLREVDIGELRAKVRYFRHEPTGAELLSLENEDENKVFGITFRTPPGDSTGLPHIMEHSVLCGSDKYPVKEPFVELLRSSLKTFLNAFTYPDKTCYPLASQNLKDFYNLIDVYIDAVFHPLIPPHTLQQEGWHYELDDLEAPLTYKGVVFNEMKGAYSSPDNLLNRFSQQVLYPDTTYGLDSGGDPLEIPNLTYRQFKEFHQTYYHPSNARIFFYGDDDPEERLRLMDAHLARFEAAQIDSAIDLQPSFDQPRQITIPYDVGDEAGERKGMMTVNWLLTDTLKPDEVLAMQILTHILIGTSASPLRKALIDSGLGDDLAGVGLENELRQMYFSTGLKGIDLGNVPEIESLIERTLQSLVKEGIDPEMVAASVNTVEFRLRENNTGSFPRGLLLMLRSLTTWLYEGDPIEPLAFEAPLVSIKEKIAGGAGYIEGLIARYLLNNNHRATVIMEPQIGLGELREAEEKARLETIRSGLSQAELQALVEDTRRLKLHQETPDPPEALATLPQLTLEDLDKEIKRTPIEVSTVGDARLLYHDLFTNDILYLDVGFNLHGLPSDLLPYVPLFGRALAQIGTEKQDYVRLAQRIGSRTGGIRATNFTSAVPNGKRGTAWLFLRAKATCSQTQDLLDILKDILLEVKLDNRERFQQMLLEEKAGMETQLVPAGHNVVNTRLRALFNEADWAAEQMGGVSYLFALRKIEKEVAGNWPAVLEKLEKIRQILINRRASLFNVTLDGENWALIQEALANFVSDLPAKPIDAQPWAFERGSFFEALTIPAQVNYVGKGDNLYQLGYQLDGSIYPITKYLRTTWLWDRVRVQGGAYGGLCTFDRRSGVFTLLSYRDPNLSDTVKIYDQTGNFLKSLTLSEDEITKSIVGAIGDMDAYQLPDAKGYTSMLYYLLGETDEYRQQIRDQILATKPQDFQRFSDLLVQFGESGKVVVLGSKQAIEAANQNWLAVRKVL